MTAFVIAVHLWLILCFYLVLRGIYLFEKKNDSRALKFLLMTYPGRVRFTAGTAVYLLLAGYFGAMALLPVIVVNYVVGFVQFHYIRRWNRNHRVGLPPNHPANK